MIRIRYEKTFLKRKALRAFRDRVFHCKNENRVTCFSKSQNIREILLKGGQKSARDGQGRLCSMHKHIWKMSSALKNACSSLQKKS